MWYQVEIKRSQVNIHAYEYIYLTVLPLFNKVQKMMITVRVTHAYTAHRASFLDFFKIINIKFKSKDLSYQRLFHFRSFKINMEFRHFQFLLKEFPS